MKDEWVKIEDQVVSEIKLPINSSYQKVGTLRRSINGGKFYVYDPATKILGEAKINEPEEVSVDGSAPKRLDLQPGCHYVEALNITNAKRRLLAGKIFVTG